MSDGEAMASDFELVFDVAPASLWIDDYSGLKAWIDSLRADGVTDLRSHLDAHPELVGEAVATIRVIDVNRSTLELFDAATTDDLRGRLADVLRADAAGGFVDELIGMWGGTVDIEMEGVNHALDGTPIDVLLQKRLLPGHEETWTRVLISIVDITDEKRQARALEEAHERAVGLFEHSPVSLWLEDFSPVKRGLDRLRADGITDIVRFFRQSPDLVNEMMKSIQVLDVNQRTVELFRAVDKDELMSRLDEVFRDSVKPTFVEELEAMWRGDLRHEREGSNRTLTGEVMDIHLEWSVLPGHEADWTRVLVSIADVTARKRAEAYMQYLGTHDSVTGLYNRAYYDDAMVRLSGGTSPERSILIIDLDGLKAANDSFGHPTGDSLIRRAADVLRAAAHDGDIVARIGGDEFAILLPTHGAIAAAALVRRIRKMVEVNNQFHQGPALEMSIGAATGIASDSLADVHRRADQRMYADKTSQRGR